MIKQLSNETLAENEIRQSFKGLIAFAPVLNRKHNIWHLGIATANEKGYSPLPVQWCNGDRFNEMMAEANRLNAQVFDLEADTSLRIIASSQY